MTRSLIFPFRKKKEPETGVRYATMVTRSTAMMVDMLLVYMIIGAPLYWLSTLFMGGVDTQALAFESQNIIQRVQRESLTVSESFGLLTEAGLFQKLLFDYSLQTFFTGVFIVLAMRRWDSTPGLMLFGNMIVDADTGGSPTTKAYIKRYIFTIISVIPLMVGIMWSMIDKRKQGWHDKAANTLVLKRRSWLFGKDYAEESADDENDDAPLEKEDASEAEAADKEELDKSV